MAIIAGKFFVRLPSKYLLMKCGTGQFLHFVNEFQPFEIEFQQFSKDFNQFFHPNLHISHALSNLSPKT